MHKRERQFVIKELVGTRAIGSQAELSNLLGTAGYEVTQASVSRDLDELGIVKVDGKYVLNDRPRGASDLGSISFATAGTNLIVGKCMPGLASALTVKIDAARLGAVVGTIAGDDTVFIAVDGPDGQSIAIKELEDLFR